MFSGYWRETIGRCEVCGRTNMRLELAHIFSRRFICIRWNDNNKLVLCSACHRKGHDQPIWFTRMAKDIKGVEIIGELEVMINNLKALPIQFFIDENKRLKELIKKL